MPISRHMPLQRPRSRNKTLAGIQPRDNYLACLQLALALLRP